MSKPTSEEVEQLKKDYRVLASLHAPIGKLDEILLTHILDAYLAQEEELKLLRESNKRKSGLIKDLTSALGNRNADNQALKAKLEGTFRFDEPKRGEVLRYITDDATGDEGNDGGQP